MTTAAEVVEHARRQPARLGSSRLVSIDGPAGSGKTTLADEVAQLTGALVVHMDDLYPGWDGLFSVAPHVFGLLEPLRRDDTGYYRRYDWELGEYLETHHVDPAPLLVLEGVGAGNRGWRDLASTLVWVETDAPTRLARGLARDGDGVRERWLRWMADEDRLFEQEGTRAAADLVLAT